MNILTIKHPNAPLAWLVFQPMNNKMNLLLQGFFGQRAKKSNKDFTPVQTSLCSLSNDHLLQIRHVFPGNKTPHRQVLGGGKFLKVISLEGNIGMKVLLWVFGSLFRCFFRIHSQIHDPNPSGQSSVSKKKQFSKRMV